MRIQRATPQQLERVKGLCDILESKIMATNKSTRHNYKDGSVVSLSLPQPTRIMPQQLEEKREKGLCYNCDSKCIKGHKCAEKKLFYIEYEEEEEKDQETSKEEDIHQDPTAEKEAMNQTISCEAFCKNYHSSNSQDRRTYREEKGARSERSHQERRNESNHIL